jgi:hypothetical protein
VWYLLVGSGAGVYSAANASRVEGSPWVYKGVTNGQSVCQKRMGIVGALLFVTVGETCCSDSMTLVKSSKTKTLPSRVQCVRADDGSLVLHSVMSSMMGGGRRLEISSLLRMWRLAG